MGRSMQERNFLRKRSGKDFQTVQNEFTVRRSALYGHSNTFRASASQRRENPAGKFQSLALAKSNSPPRVRLPVVHIKPDPIVSMAIHDMEKVHAKRYNSQVSPITAYLTCVRKFSELFFRPTLTQLHLDMISAAKDYARNIALEVQRERLRERKH